MKFMLNRPWLWAEHRTPTSLSMMTFLWNSAMPFLMRTPVRGLSWIRLLSNWPCPPSSTRTPERATACAAATYNTRPTGTVHFRSGTLCGVGRGSGRGGNTLRRCRSAGGWQRQSTSRPSRRSIKPLCGPPLRISPSVQGGGGCISLEKISGGQISPPLQIPVHTLSHPHTTLPKPPDFARGKISQPSLEAKFSHETIPARNRSPPSLCSGSWPQHMEAADSRGGGRRGGGLK